MKKCPFNQEVCNEQCSLYIQKDDLNELVANKLVSIGALSQNGGCSLKQSALVQLRDIFENTTTRR